MGFDECHLFMRFLQFDYAVYKEGAGKPPPLFITAVQDDDSAVDRLAFLFYSIVKNILFLINSNCFKMFLS